MTLPTFTSKTDGVDIVYAADVNNLQNEVAPTAAAALAVRYSTAHTSTATTLTDASYPLQSINPGSAGTVSLPTVSTANHGFYIVNRSTANKLTVNYGASFVCYVPVDSVGIFVPDSTAGWKGIAMPKYSTAAAANFLRDDGTFAAATVASLASTAVTFSSTTPRVLGSSSSGNGINLTIGTGLQISASTLQVSSIGSTLINLTNANRIIGSSSSGAGVELTLAGLGISGSTLQRSALTGDVTASAGDSTTSIASGAVTLAKMANLSTATLIGRNTTGTGVPEAITIAQAHAWGGVGIPLTICKPSIETVNNSTTFQSDDDFTFSMAANEVYYLEFVLIVAAANQTADIKFQLSVPAGCTYYIGGNASGNAISAFSAVVSTGIPIVLSTTSVAMATENGTVGIQVKAIVTNGANAGTCVLQWAQNTLSATNLSIEANSLMRYTRIK